MKKFIALVILLGSTTFFAGHAEAAPCRIAQLSVVAASTTPADQTVAPGATKVRVAEYDVTASCDLEVGSVYIQADPTTALTSLVDTVILKADADVVPTTPSTASSGSNDGAYVFGPLSFTAGVPKRLVVYATIDAAAPQGSFRLFINGFGTVPGTTFANGTGKMFNLVGYPFPKSSLVTVAPAQPQLRLKVLSPNGGEVYQAGQQISVSWTSSGYGPNSNISFNLAEADQNGNHNTFLMSITGLVDDGGETLTIPANVPTGSNYLAHLTIFDPETSRWQSDSSDSVFTIQNTNIGKPIASPTLPSNTTSPSTTSFAFTRGLKIGLRGADVVALQDRLRLEGVFTGTSTGYFGPMTQAAVKRYQTKYGIPAVGSVGPRTLQSLNK